jgi:hypothetical protein
MNEFLIAWTICATVGCFVVLALVVGFEVRDHRASAQPKQEAPLPRVPEQRQPTSAAAVVVVHDAESFERFLAELIMTPHIEEVLS